MGGRGGRSHSASGGGNNRNAETFLRNTYGVNHANAIVNILRQSPKVIQDMWADYANLFRGKAISGRGASYNPIDDSVHIDIKYVSKGDLISTPYSVLFHEYGHMADYLISRERGGGRFTAYSELFQGLNSKGEMILSKNADGGLLGRTAKQELQGHINRTGSPTKLINEANRKYSRLDRTDISDMMEGAGIGVEFPLGSGHRLSYWRGRDNGKEIFAEITSAEAAHSGSLKAIKEYFPRTYSVYQDMMKARKKR